jgi:hypothetical protein
MEIHEKQGYRSEGRGVNESDNMYRVVLQGVTQRELFALEAWVARQNTEVEPGNIHQQLKCEIAEDLSEIESHSQFIQRKSVRVRELVRRLSHV